AQAAALLAFDAMDSGATEDTVYYFAGMEGVRFKRPVEPGNQLILEATLLRSKSGIFKFQTRALVDGTVAVEAELTCAFRKIA
ncbi:MAG TPA: 3-hydroxyacyl-[acyl-carrier-protein] dehydratase FabZ, partial [Rhodoferax sp.]|nr:3-hydroxyacyl-[acyl-carrier-protein] dehydratase FabZ [Rhodoferax sp.]